MADVTQRGIGVLPAPGPPSVNAFNEILSVDCVVGSGRGSVAEATSLAQATELADGPFTAVNGFGGKGAKGGVPRNGISLLPLYGDEMTTHPAAAAVKAAILAGVLLASLLDRAYVHSEFVDIHPSPRTRPETLLGGIFTWVGQA